MSKSELQGLQIVVTRPSAQAEPWAQRLRELGAEVQVIPLLEIVPVAEPAQQQAIKNCILDLDVYQKAIFVSQNAVEQAFAWIDRYWPQLPVGIAFMAVGDTTARQLQAMDVAVTDLAHSQSGAMTSETLLQAPALQQVAGEKIVIFRGLGGRPHLGEVLAERGATVHYCELYERRLPAAAATQLAAVLARLQAQPQAPLVVALHSGEALENLHTILQRQPTLQVNALNNLQLLVPSQRVQAQAQAAGFRQVVAAQNATDPCMLQGLIDLQRKLTKV